eukprot:gb/GFBE01078384.1/.p1 GENE.gb/GFBE01078384.1/~~gb/GFBE01078384.1/.p1  ORF type:complete len:193 (+),score=18.78 gb/GFBE01078384.1/:1-579(+)
MTKSSNSRRNVSMWARMTASVGHFFGRSDSMDQDMRPPCPSGILPTPSSPPRATGLPVNLPASSSPPAPAGHPVNLPALPSQPHLSGFAADVAYAQMVAQSMGITILTPDILPKSGPPVQPAARPSDRNSRKTSRKRTPAEVAEDLEAWPVYQNADIAVKERIRAALNLPPHYGHEDQMPDLVALLPGAVRD